jgi:riboflavin biosynthesis pyrimidine reductase
VGGPKLAASLTKLGLLDEYQIYLWPFVLGGGNPYFAEARTPLRGTIGLGRMRCG